MKKTLTLLFLLILSSSVSLVAQKATPKNSDPPKLKVYYFHPDERCPIDQSIEKNTRDIMSTDYKEKVKDGTIDFRIINTDDKSNAKLVSGFDINAQALYIVKYDKGKEVRQDLTKFAFESGLSNPLKFRNGLKDAINENLK